MAVGRHPVEAPHPEAARPGLVTHGRGTLGNRPRAWSIDSDSRARHLPAWASADEQVGDLAHPPVLGRVGQLDQAHWTSSPGGWSITATARRFAAWHVSHAGRSPRARTWRGQSRRERESPRRNAGGGPSPTTSPSRKPSRHLTAGVRRTARPASRVIGEVRAIVAAHAGRERLRPVTPHPGHPRRLRLRRAARCRPGAHR